MNLIILPGNSSSNKIWAENVASLFKLNFADIRIASYGHWVNKDKNIDLTSELTNVAKLVEGLSNYIVIAKSVGCILALEAISEGIIEPEKCVFLGVAVSWAELMGINIEDLIVKNTKKTLIIQKTNDPAVSSKELGELLNKIKSKNYKILEIEGNNHKYENIVNLKQTIIEFIS